MFGKVGTKGKPRRSQHALTPYTPSRSKKKKAILFFKKHAKMSIARFLDCSHVEKVYLGVTIRA